jgi:hypothetical protein
MTILDKYDPDDPPRVEVGKLFTAEQAYIFKATWPTMLLALIVIAAYAIVGTRLANAQHHQHLDTQAFGDWGFGHETFHGFYNGGENGGLADAFTMPARNGDQLFIAFFCTAECLLQHVPPQCCGGRA